MLRTRVSIGAATWASALTLRMEAGADGAEHIAKNNGTDKTAGQTMPVLFTTNLFNILQCQGEPYKWKLPCWIDRR